jgi:hypothetical protein
MKSLFRVFFIVFLLTSCSKKIDQEENTSLTITNIPQSKGKSFDYKPELPINGKLYAAIEIGSAGLNYFIVNMDKQNRWELVQAGFGESDLIEKTTDIEAVFLKIESYKRKIIKSGVPKNDIYVIASSSAIELRKIEDIRSRLELSGIKLRTVNAEQEGYFDLLATVPKEFVEESFLVDIGSGNTKVTWITEIDTFSIETFGSKYYINDLHDTTAFRVVRDLLLQIPIKNRNLCFMLGGIPYEFAAVTGKKNGRYTILQRPGKYSPSSKKGKAGKIIYSAFYLEPTYSYIFDWDANFSIGYLISLGENR